MPMSGGRGIHDGGVRFHPGSDHLSTHGTGGKTDTRSATYSIDLPSVREGIDIEDALFFSKPDRSLDWRPVSFDTLQVQILLTRKGSEVGARHSNAFIVDAVGMCSCHIVPGMRILSVQHTAVGDKYGGKN